MLAPRKRLRAGIRIECSIIQPNSGLFAPAAEAIVLQFRPYPLQLLLQPSNHLILHHLILVLLLMLLHRDALQLRLGRPQMLAEVLNIILH